MFPVRLPVLLLACVCLSVPALAVAQPPRLDLHGDQLPEGALARLGTLRWRSDTGYTALAYSPDGKVLACATGDHVIRLLDADSGKELRALPGHTATVFSLTYCASGKILVSIGDDEKLR